MLTQNADENTRLSSRRLSFWLRVREYAVPPAMIATATARRHAGDWAGACTAAGIDVDLDLRADARTHGRELATRVRADLRRLAPDLLRWHLPRIAPDGLLRPGLTIGLARYAVEGRDPLHLVARTAPAWADAGQRISLALWDGSTAGAARHHPHARPGRRFRLDLHRHLWDAGRSGELRPRSGADATAVDRWAAEAGILLRSEGRSTGAVTVRLGSRRRLVLDVATDGFHLRTASTDGEAAALPVLPDAATWVPPDLELLRNGLIGADRLHPLVASALVPDHVPAGPSAEPGPDRQPTLVDCRGARHRIGVVDGVLTPLDHDPAELRREELLAALSGTPLPCLQVIDQAHRRPECLPGVRERLDHGDTAGALAVVEGLLGPGAVLRHGELLDELEAAARQRITHGLFRAGLTGSARGPFHSQPRRRDAHRSRPRLAHHR